MGFDHIILIPSDLLLQVPVGAAPLSREDRIAELERGVLLDENTATVIGAVGSHKVNFVLDNPLVGPASLLAKRNASGNPVAFQGAFFQAVQCSASDPHKPTALLSVEQQESHARRDPARAYRISWCFLSRAITDLCSLTAAGVCTACAH